MPNKTMSPGDRLLYMGIFPIGHGAVDWAGGAMWLLAPAIAFSLGLSPGQIGLLFALNSLGAGLVYIPAGICGDSRKNRGILLLGTFWWVTMAYLLASVVSNFWILALFMALASAGAGAWHPIAMGAMVQRMPHRRGFALAVHGVGGKVSEVVAPLSVGFLLAFFDWRQALQLSTIPAIFTGLIFLWFVPKVHSSIGQRPSRTDLKKILRQWSGRRGVSILAVFTLYNISVMALMSMVALYLEAARGLQINTVGLIFSVMLVASTAAGLGLARLSDVVGRRPVILVGLILGSLFLFLLAITENIMPLAACAIGAGLFLLGIRAVVTATAIEVVDRWESTMLGIALAVGEGLGALGALLAGFAGEINLSLSLIFGGGVAVIAGIVVYYQPTDTTDSGARNHTN